MVDHFRNIDGGAQLISRVMQLATLLHFQKQPLAPLPAQAPSALLDQAALQAALQQQQVPLQILKGFAKANKLPGAR